MRSIWVWRAIASLVALIGTVPERNSKAVPTEFIPNVHAPISRWIKKVDIIKGVYWGADE